MLKELADACARGGIRLGFYYSQSQDWHEPNGAGNTWDFGPDEKKDYDEYLLGKAEPQIKELLTGYGPVALIWFDTPRMMTGERAHRFTRIVRSMQPDTLIDGRLGVEGDYVTTGDTLRHLAMGLARDSGTLAVSSERYGEILAEFAGLAGLLDIVEHIDREQAPRDPGQAT